MDSQRFMDVLVGHPILCIGLATMLYWLWLSYVNNSVMRKVSQTLGGRTYLIIAATQLKAFPTVGSTWSILSLIDAIKFITNGRDILEAGRCKVRISNYILPGYG